MTTQPQQPQIIETHHMVDDLTFQEILATLFEAPAPVLELEEVFA